jgi:hypothetical protein
VDNLNNIRYEASRHCRNKKGKYLKDKINELAMSRKNKDIRDLYRGINKFKRGYQLRSNLVKDENGDLLADSHHILNRWKNYFHQLLNLHSLSLSLVLRPMVSQPVSLGIKHPSGAYDQIFFSFGIWNASDSYVFDSVGRPL